MSKQAMTKKEQRLRGELEWVRGKYDSGAVPDAIYQVIRSLEVDIAWLQNADLWATAPATD